MTMVMAMLLVWLLHQVFSCCLCRKKVKLHKHDPLRKLKQKVTDGCAIFQPPILNYADLAKKDCSVSGTVTVHSVLIKGASLPRLFRELN